MHAGTPEMALDDAWGDRLPMPPLDRVDPTTTTLLRRLLRARRAFLSAPLEVREATGRRIVVERGDARLTLDHDAAGEPILEI